MPATLVSGQGAGDAGSTAGHGQARRSAKGVFAPTIGFAAFCVLLPPNKVLYGAAAGGGKSDALLMGALQYVHVPNYAAVIFRKTYTDLFESDAIGTRAQQWVAEWNTLGLQARWHGGDRAILFPKNSKISFRHLNHENAKYNYQGAAYQCHWNST